MRARSARHRTNEKMYCAHKNVRTQNVLCVYESEHKCVVCIKKECKSSAREESAASHKRKQISEVVTRTQAGVVKKSQVPQAHVHEERAASHERRADKNKKM